jgi:hypothetical protein
LKRIIILLSFITVIAAIALSCERDDICAETTATTPSLIIEFYDINNQDELKSVRQLRVKGINDDGTLGNIIPNNLPSNNTVSPSSIVLPLRFQEDNELTTTRFQLEKDADLADNEDETDDSNIDVIEITYTPEFIYVSRACGYKSIFNIGPTGGIVRVTDADNWIFSTEILNETIENEQEAHIIIYH